jgi:hypothetical protein
MKFWTIALAGLLVVGVVGVAEARGGKGGHKSDNSGKAKGGSVSMATLDTNGDGTISKEEWDAAFAKLDKNSDGKLTADELKGKSGKHQGGKKGGGRKNR